MQNINIKYISGHITFSFGLVIITEYNIYIKHYTDNLPPTTKLGQGNIFTGICDSVHRGRGSASVHSGIPPPPQDQAPPRTRHPPGTRHTPRDQAPPRTRQAPRRAEHTGRYGQRAGGMHPTGMQSCFLL